MENAFLRHQQSKPHCRKCGRRRRKYPPYPNVLIDQVIEVQQLSTPHSQTRNREFTDRLKRVQQMIYLRENINKYEGTSNGS